jgi:serpin B
MAPQSSTREMGVGGKSRVATVTSDLPPGVAALNRFAFRIYHQIASKSQDNIAFSPFSISAALAMTHAGARGQTAEEIRKALDLPQNEQYVHSLLGSLWKGVSGEGYLLRIANRLWGQIGKPFLPQFLRITKDMFGAELAAADFTSCADMVREEINTWVEKITAEKIRDLLAPGVLNYLTRLVLVNAVYFKGEWTSRFDAGCTTDAPFYVEQLTTVRASLMYQQAVFSYAAVPDVQILSLPYGDKRLSMLVLLPSRESGISGLEQRLSENAVAEWVDELQGEEVEVFLPRFKMETDFRLEQVLQAIGIRLAFQEREADFSGINGSQDLYLSAAIHQAFIEVNEEGTEAAAATAMTAGIPQCVGWSPPAIPVFRADRPFVFLIRENHSGAILFMGRVMDPTTK